MSNVDAINPNKSEDDARVPKVTDDPGVPNGLAYWAIVVGLALTAAGAAIIILTDRAPQVGVLMTCVGFGIILAAFGSRAAGGWQKLTATGAGALAIGLFVIYQQFAPVVPEFKKRGQISGDINKVADLRIVDEQPLYSLRDPTTRTMKFIILEKQFRNPQLTIQVDTNETADSDQFFEMFGDGRAIVTRYFRDPSLEIIKWKFDLANKVITDGSDVIFKVPDRLEERQITPRPTPGAWLPDLTLIRSALAGMIEPREVPRITNDLKSDNPIVRRNARDDLVLTGPDGIKPMMAAWRQSPDDYRLKLGVVFALNGMLRENSKQNQLVAKELGDDDIALLVRAASDNDKTVRLQAAEFLFKLKDPRIVEPSLQVVRDAKDGDGVYNAVLILKSVYGDLGSSAKTRVSDELQKSIPSDSKRTRDLFNQFAK